MALVCHACSVDSTGCVRAQQARAEHVKAQRVASQYLATCDAGTTTIVVDGDAVIRVTA
jgi:hypothetical protein